MVPHTPLTRTSARPIQGTGPARVRYAYVQKKKKVFGNIDIGPQAK